MATIVIGVLLALSTLNGLRRGMLKEGTALIGILLGALLAQGWAVQWARQLLGKAAQETTQAVAYTAGERTLALAILIGVALLSGYGSGLLLPRRQPERRRMTWGQRVGGGLLGFVNMGLLASFVLLLIQRLWYDTPSTGTTLGATTSPGSATTAAGSWIQQTPLTRFMLERLGVLLLGVAVAFALISLIVGLTRLLRRPVVAPTPQGTKPGATIPGTKPEAKPAGAAGGAAGLPRPTGPVPVDNKPVPSSATAAAVTPDWLKPTSKEELAKPAPGAVPSLLEPQRKPER